MPPTKRIYADFNGITTSPRNPDRSAVELDTMGTLADLASEGVILREGMHLVVYDQSDAIEDLEADVEVIFDDERGLWIGEMTAGGYRYVPTRASNVSPLVCVSCRAELGTWIVSHGLAIGDRCPACTGLLHAPIEPPRGLGWGALRVPGGRPGQP